MKIDRNIKLPFNRLEYDFETSGIYMGTFDYNSFYENIDKNVSDKLIAKILEYGMELDKHPKNVMYHTNNDNDIWP